MTNLSVSDLALPARLWLARGKQALQADNRAEAVAAFRRAVAADPKHIDSWLWLAGFCADPHESLRCLAQVLELEPHNDAAHEGIRWARKQLAALDEPALAPARPDATHQVKTADGLAAGPEHRTASAGAESAPRESAPHHAAPHILRSTIVLLLLFIVLGGGSFSFWDQPVPGAAADASEDALDMSVSAPLADLVRSVTPSFSPLPLLAPVDRYQLNYEHGVELRRQNDLQGAMRAYQAAIDLDPNAIEARSELAQVKADLARAAGAPDPVSTTALAAGGAKWFDVNLTTQRFRALRGQTTVYSFPTSTGIPSMRTVPGRFRILDKISDAYSRIWKLQMPYWMGIYWAGTAENGIHALPINRKGQTLWGGLLGRPASFGCVILDTKTAKLMFNWADIGTPFIIHR